MNKSMRFASAARMLLECMDLQVRKGGLPAQLHGRACKLHYLLDIADLRKWLATRLCQACAAAQ